MVRERCANAFYSYGASGPCWLIPDLIYGATQMKPCHQSQQSASQQGAVASRFALVII